MILNVVNADQCSVWKSILHCRSQSGQGLSLDSVWTCRISRILQVSQQTLPLKFIKVFPDVKTCQNQNRRKLHVNLCKRVTCHRYPSHEALNTVYEVKQVKATGHTNLNFKSFQTKLFKSENKKKGQKRVQNCSSLQ